MNEKRDSFEAEKFGSGVCIRLHSNCDLQLLLLFLVSTSEDTRDRERICTIIKMGLKMIMDCKGTCMHIVFDAHLDLLQDGKFRLSPMICLLPIRRAQRTKINSIQFDHR